MGVNSQVDKTFKHKLDECNPVLQNFCHEASCNNFAQGKVVIEVKNVSGADKGRGGRHTGIDRNSKEHPHHIAFASYCCARATWKGGKEKGAERGT